MSELRKADARSVRLLKALKSMEMNRMNSALNQENGKLTSLVHSLRTLLKETEWGEFGRVIGTQS